MSRGWHLGGVWYSHVSDLASLPGGASWHLVRRGEQGTRCLLQHWEPAPRGTEQDQIKHDYLQQIQDADGGDPFHSSFGACDGRLWTLQELPGESLAKAWSSLPLHQRESLTAGLRSHLAASRTPRLLHPEVIALTRRGPVLPWVLGAPPLSLDTLLAQLEDLPPQDTPLREAFPEGAPELAPESALPIRGRSQELTYLKSLMFGLGSGTSQERIIIIQGEEGLGKDRLAAYAAAAAETEGIRVDSLEMLREESPGHFLSRLLENLIQGQEAEFYAGHPELARALASRVESFSFLRSTRRPPRPLPQVEPAELSAAQTLMGFVRSRQPRMVLLRGVDRAGTELLSLLKELIRNTPLPWLLVVSNGGPIRTARPLLGPLSQDPDVAILNLKRLADDDLRAVLDDLLGPHELPESMALDLCRASLGNAGLLRNLLERAQLDGALLWSRDRWRAVPGRPLSLEVSPDLLSGILSGRFRRLPPPAALLVRFAALGDDSISLSALGRAVGLAGEPLEEALQALVSGHFIQILDGRASPLGPEVRELALGGIPPAETKRLAGTLLRALQEESRSPVLSVRLQSYASDAPTALARVMEAIEQPPPSPGEAEAIVRQTLALSPTPAQRARLWEFLADAWVHSTIRGRVPSGRFEGHSPYELALDSLDRALQEGGSLGPLTQRARALRKKAFLELRLRRIEQAEHTARKAQSLLMDHLFHEEQARLRLALGRGFLFRGHVSQAARHLEEGRLLAERVEQRESHIERAGLLLDLGRIQMERCQFQGALGSLLAAQRVLEHSQDHRRLVGVLLALAQTHFAKGEPREARHCADQAMAAARAQDDLELIADCQACLGIMASVQQDLDRALACLEEAEEGYQRLCDRAATARAGLWKARTLACLGEPVLSEHLLLELSGSGDPLSAQEQGERLFLQAEILDFRGTWEDAARVYAEAADCYRGFGLGWRELLSRLRRLQARARLLDPEPGVLLSCLEDLKEPSAQSGSRWVLLEWHLAKALILAIPGHLRPADSLRAWSEVLASARELERTALVLESCTQGACLLQHQGEALGAQAKIQEACTSFQELWGRVPAAFGPGFLGRPDLNRFRLAVESIGMETPFPHPPADHRPEKAP
nr:hypothetical protein [uncultured Holophaga sp.]